MSGKVATDIFASESRRGGEKGFEGGGWEEDLIAGEFGGGRGGNGIL